MSTKSNHNRGFTLIELIVVLMIGTAIASFAIVKYEETIEKTKFNKTALDLKSIHCAFEIYKTKNGTYPEFDLGSLHEINQLLDLDIRNSDYTFLYGSIAPGYRVAAVRNTKLEKIYSLCLKSDEVSGNNPCCTSILGNCPYDLGNCPVLCVF